MKAKYRLVKQHNRVGRMADTQEFTNFEFPLDRISPELLAELKTVAPSALTISDDKLVIKHLYTERKMIPLNLYLDKADEQQTRLALEEYGNAIKQLAAANIFPGDMLFKNFGVTRHGRVVFYDYDEICYMTECNFRQIPPPRYPEDEWSAEPWYSVAPNDIFPRSSPPSCCKNRRCGRSCCNCTRRCSTPTTGRCYRATSRWGCSRMSIPTGARSASSTSAAADPAEPAQRARAHRSNENGVAQATPFC